MAGDAGDAGERIAATESAARALVEARAAALRPAPAPRPPAAPARAPRPGLELSPSAVEALPHLPPALPLRDGRPGADARRARRASVGVAAHAALEAHYRPGGTGGDGDALVRRFAAALRREGVAATAEGRQALARGREALPPYHERLVRSGTRPVAVEREFTLTVGPHRVHGRVDRIDAHPAGGHQIVDYKTGKPPAAGARGDEDDLVLRLYLLGAREAWGLEPRGATLVHVLDGAARGVHPEAERRRRRGRGGARRRRRHRGRQLRAAAVVGLPHLRLRAALPGAGPMTPLGSLEPGSPLEGVYAVRRKERRLSRQGRPFLALTLADATGAVPAMLFDEPDYFGGSSPRAIGFGSRAGSASATAARA